MAVNANLLHNYFKKQGTVAKGRGEDGMANIDLSPRNKKSGFKYGKSRNAKGKALKRKVSRPKHKYGAY